MRWSSGSRASSATSVTRSAGRWSSRPNLLEEAGHSVLRLNTGNPALFDFEAPEEIVQDMIRMLPQAHGYTDSRGVLPARRAVAQRYQARGLDVDVDDVFLGNGVSELISMAVQALVEDGDEVLVPAPDYPLWTAVTTLAGGQRRALPLRRVRPTGTPTSTTSPRRSPTAPRPLVIINPNNPTGAVYPKEILEGMLDLARRHGLMVMADEIYDQILYDDAVHHDVASLAPDLVVLTFCGLSKTYRVAGFRSGWLVVTGPTPARPRLPRGPGDAGLDAPVREHPGAVRHPGRARRASDDRRPHRPRRAAPRAARPGVGRAQRDPRRLLRQAARRALRVPEARPRASTRSRTTSSSCSTCCCEEKIQVVQGTGFNWPTPDHFRILTLPHAETLDDAITRIGRFLETYRQE